MKIEEYLDSLKKDYEKTEATWHLKMSGWQELTKRIELLEPQPVKPRWFNFAFSFALVLLFIGSLFGTYRVASAAMPGDVLYPVKLLSEKIVEKASGSNQIVIDHRADEIIGLSKKEEVNTTALKQVVTEYAQSVDQARAELKINGKPSINFQQKLDEQHSEFDRIGNDHPDMENDIKAAKDVSSHDDGHSGD